MMKTNGAQLMGRVPVAFIGISHDVVSSVLHSFRCICDFALRSRSSNILEAARIINRLKPRNFFQRVSPVARVESTSFFDTYKRQHHEFR